MSKTAIGHFMNQKWFHPSNFQNQKRVWQVEQKAKAEEKRQKLVAAEYAKEQAIRDAKGFALMTKKQSAVEKSKFDVSFLYDKPPGYADKKAEEGEEGEKKKLTLNEERALPLDVKFAFLKGAPRDGEYTHDLEVRDKPFGMEVRNVRCLKCLQWGHQNVDRVCPLFGKDIENEKEGGFEDPLVLMKQMQSDGLVISQRALGRSNDPTAENQQLLADDDEEVDPELAFLSTLSDKEKRKLFKKLEKMEKKEKKKAKKAEKKKSSKKESSDSESDSEDEREKERHEAHKRRHRRRDDDEEEESEEEGGRGDLNNKDESRSSRSSHSSSKQKGVRSSPEIDRSDRDGHRHRRRSPSPDSHSRSRYDDHRSTYSSSSSSSRRVDESEAGRSSRRDHIHGSERDSERQRDKDHGPSSNPSRHNPSNPEHASSSSSSSASRHRGYDDDSSSAKRRKRDD